MKRKTILAQELVEYLLDNEIPFLVLRNESEILTDISHDIDLIIPKTDLIKFEITLKKFANSKSVTVLKMQRKYSFRCYVIIFDNLGEIDFLKVDLYIDHITYRGLTLFKFKELKRDAYFVSHIPVIAKRHQFTIIFFKEILYNKKIDFKHQHRLSNLLNNISIDNLITLFNKLIDKKLSRRIINYLERQEYSEIGKIHSRIGKSLILKAFMKNPIGFLWGRVKWIGVFISNIINPTGFFLVFLGPDGSGKSTLSNLIRSKVEYQLFDGVIYYHGHFGFLPRLNKLKSIFYRINNKSKKEAGKKRNLTHNDQLVHSYTSSIVYVSYYFIDYVLGHLYMRISKARTKMVMFDRYYYDYYIQPEWIKTSKLLLKIFETFIPRPDLYVFLIADPEIIHSRKPELTVDEIKRQQTILKELSKKLTPNIVVDTSNNPEANLNSVLNSIIRILVKKGVKL